MGYIYKISNSINDKVYIGQTVRPIEKRFAQHKIDAKKYLENSNIKLYNAMNRYGADNFTISLLEECSDDCLNEREMYWIKEFDSFKSGYNSTMGGEGRLRGEDEPVMQCWNENMIVAEIMEKTGHSYDFVTQALTRHGISKREWNDRAHKAQSSKVKVPIYQYDLGGKYVGEYASIWDAERETGINHACIGGVLSGEHFSAGFYQWSRIKTDNIGKCKHQFCRTARTVYQYTLDGEYITSYKSFTQAAKAVGLKSILPIRRVCYNKAQTSKGFRWSLAKYEQLPI